MWKQWNFKARAQGRGVEEAVAAPGTEQPPKLCFSLSQSSQELHTMMCLFIAGPAFRTWGIQMKQLVPADK